MSELEDMLVSRTYEDELGAAMVRLAEDERVVFIGQGLYEPSPFYGTLTGVPRKRLLEMPCAEILSTGVGVGLALAGWVPVLLFQRMDFMLLAADQLINHAALMPRMSGGRIRMPMLVRACVGSSDFGFDCGLQHKKDLSSVFEPYMTLHRLQFGEDGTPPSFRCYRVPEELTMIVEYKDLYGQRV